MGGPFFNSVLLTQGDIYKDGGTVRKYPLGTRGYTRDGRVFRFARNGTVALKVGRLVQSEAVPTFADDQILKAAGTVTSGATKCALTFSTNVASTAKNTADYYNEGYLFVNDGDGEGQLVQINTHELFSSAAAEGVSTIQFMPGDELTTRVTTASEWGVIANPYERVIIPANAVTGIILGIAPRAVDASDYFWLQTWGPSTCLVFSTNSNIPAAGYAMVHAATTVGSVMRYYGDATTKKSSVGLCFSTGWRASQILLSKQPIGTVMEVGATGEFGMIDLKLAP